MDNTKKEIITWRGIMDKEINKKGARDIIEYLDSWEKIMPHTGSVQEMYAVKTWQMT